MPKLSNELLDDPRVKAVYETLDISKPWGKHSHDQKRKALDKWHSICSNWYNDHKEWADSPEGIQSGFKELKSALLRIRRYIKRKGDQEI
jgi:hypothetical protein